MAFRRCSRCRSGPRPDRRAGVDAGRLQSLKNIGAGGALTPEELITDCRAPCRIPTARSLRSVGNRPADHPPTMEAEAHGGRYKGGPPRASISASPTRTATPCRRHVGEVICCNPFDPEGYFENDDETAAYPLATAELVGRSTTITDDDGFITLVGVPEMIVSGGIGIYPRGGDRDEDHPAVAECDIRCARRPLGRR